MLLEALSLVCVVCVGVAESHHKHVELCMKCDAEPSDPPGAARTLAPTDTESTAWLLQPVLVPGLPITSAQVLHCAPPTLSSSQS